MLGLSKVLKCSRSCNTIFWRVFMFLHFFLDMQHSKWWDIMNVLLCFLINQVTFGAWHMNLTLPEPCMMFLLRFLFQSFNCWLHFVIGRLCCLVCSLLFMQWESCYPGFEVQWLAIWGCIRCVLQPSPYQVSCRHKAFRGALQ